MGWGFADKVRKIMVELGKGGREIAVADVALRLDLISKLEKRPVYGAMSDFMDAGEVERVRPGVYRYIGKKKDVPEKRVVMWRLLRARRMVTISDLEELAGVCGEYARQWLTMLIRRGIVVRIGEDKYRLKNDPVVMPEDEDKAEQLRKLRARNKQTLSAILAAQNALLAAGTAMTEAKAALENSLITEGGPCDEQLDGVSK